MNVGKHYLSPKLEVRAEPEKGGFGVYAIEAVAAGEIVSVWGGYIVTVEQLEQLPHEIQQHTVQIEEGLYSATIGGAETADFINHSCDPNLQAEQDGYRVFLKALRDIESGEELSYDYGLIIDARQTAKLKDDYACRCRAANCRGTMLARKRR